jgi:hypothetical protein
MSIDNIFAQFNAAEVEPSKPTAILPAGWYQVVIDKTTNKTNKAMTGSYLELELVIVDGEYKGRRIWDRLNLDNPNQTAVDIAKASLSAICHAINVLTPQGPEDLKDKPLDVKLAIQPAKGQYSESNVVKGYAPPGTESNRQDLVGTAAQAMRAAVAPKKPAAPLDQPDDDLPF